jgi:tellurite resistance protein TerC
MGGYAASQYITAYLVEKSLSVDNVFLWAVLFTYFGVPSQYQHRVLFWGIFGALVMRAAFIFGGLALLNSIHWIIYVFGAVLLFTAYRLYTNDEKEEDPAHNPVIKFVRRFVPQTEHYHEDKFLVNLNGKTLATPLLTVLIVVELSDVIFAVDSIPAVLAVTQDKFLVFSSNAFAILGLRALYFLLADLKDRFIYLSNGLAVILAFVGIKFMVSEFYKIPTYLSLLFIAAVLTVTIVLSIRHTREEKKVKSS